MVKIKKKSDKIKKKSSKKEEGVLNFPIKRGVKTKAKIKAIRILILVGKKLAVKKGNKKNKKRIRKNIKKNRRKSFSKRVKRFSDILFYKAWYV
jgi:hypothetical protein